MSVGALTTVAFAGLPKLVDTALAATAPLPDLIVSSVIVPTVTAAGQPFRFGATVRNRGAGPTPVGVEIGVGFYVDGRQVAWSAGDTTSLGPGSSVTVYADHTYPSGPGTWVATAGAHSVEANINWVDRFPETSRTNNSLTVPFTVAAAPGARPVNVTLPVITGTPTVGDVLTVSTGTWS